MNFIATEYKPALSLQHHVESYWHGQFNLDRSPEFSQHVIPNGCIELIIHLSDDHCALTRGGESYSKSPPYTLLGVHKQTYIVKFSELVNCFGIRFYPDGFRNIFGVQPGLFLSSYEDGIDVAGKKLEEFCNRIRESATGMEKIKQADDFFNKQIAINQSSFDRTHMTMKLIRQRNGLIEFEEIKAKIPISLRQLQREFKSNYGLKINDYMRLTRLNAINKYMLSHPEKLTELAYELDFTDQSHFIREFKHFTGIAPGKFFKKKGDFIMIPV